MFRRHRNRYQKISHSRQPLNQVTSFPTQHRTHQTSFPTQNRTKKTSFPELVGRSSKEAVAYLSARGFKPVLMKPNQAAIMDYRTDRVRVMTDPSGRKVIETPRIG